MEAMIKDLNPIIQMLILMATFSLLPFAFACLTSFMRFIIVFSILKSAILLNFWQLFMINVENILFIFFLKN